MVSSKIYLTDFNITKTRESSTSSPKMLITMNYHLMFDYRLREDDGV